MPLHRLAAEADGGGFGGPGGLINANNSNINEKTAKAT